MVATAHCSFSLHLVFTNCMRRKKWASYVYLYLYHDRLSNTECHYTIHEWGKIRSDQVRSYAGPHQGWCPSQKSDRSLDPIQCRGLPFVQMDGWKIKSNQNLISNVRMSSNGRVDHLIKPCNLIVRSQQTAIKQRTFVQLSTQAKQYVNIQVIKPSN